MGEVPMTYKCPKCFSILNIELKCPDCGYQWKKMEEWEKINFKYGEKDE